MEGAKEKTRIPGLIVLLLWGAAVLNISAMFISRYADHVALVWILYYLCHTLSLLTEVLGLGGAIWFLSTGSRGGMVRIWALTLGCNGVVLLTSAICESFLYGWENLWDVLPLHLLSVLINLCVQLLLYIAILFFLYLVFFRGADLPLQNTLRYANIATTLILLVYQLLGMLPETIEFIRTYFPHIYPEEIGTMIFEYLFLFVSLFGGYLVMYATQRYIQKKSS